jgi:hypothetical protein
MDHIANIEPVERGGVLIHIGPHKTGTTAVQDALVRAAPELAAQRFQYFASGTQNNVNVAVKAFASSIDRGFKYHSRSSKNPSHWEVVYNKLTTSVDQTAIISAEDLADLSESHVKQFVQSMGDRSVRVVMTLRSLAEIIPSQWQQFVKRGPMPSLEDWASALFSPNSAERKVDLFWQRHRHDELLHRWVSAVGADRFTVVVVDSRERSAIYPVFEQLIGLTRGTLQPGSYVNESMSIEQAEIVRATYLELERTGIGHMFGERGLRIRIHKHLLESTTSSTGHKPLLPKSSHENTVRVAREIRAAIEKAGVRVIGNLDQLERIPTGDMPNTAGNEVLVPASIGGAAAVSLLRSAGIEGIRERAMYQSFIDAVPLRVLLAVTYERLLQRVGIRKKQ